MIKHFRKNIYSFYKMSQTNSNINLDQLIDFNSAAGQSLYDEPILVLIPLTNNNEPEIVKEVESIEKQALKLSYQQEQNTNY